ncbi:MAG: 2-oxo acid dehydrogenase subunit E2 [Planctomycetia bacterium]|nr:2-oxo acid dehydrogenase subunit E2 [Planctomycetia bacterium]
MAIEITVPRLGWNMDEGVFVGWLKANGERVRPGEMIYSLEGDKAIQEVESLDGGILRIPPNAPKAGERVVVGALLAYLVAEGEKAPFELPSRGTAATKAQAPAAAGRSQATVSRATAPSIAADRSSETSRNKAISPRARRVAAELGVDWQSIHGSGRTGRIRERDVRAAAQTSPIGAQPKPSGAKRVPLTAARRTIARRMLESARSTAPVTLTTKVDATNLVGWRKKMEAAAAGGIVPGYTDIFVKLAAVALKEHPQLNARLDGETMLLLEEINMGFAVDTPWGLVVPVLRDAARLDMMAVTGRSRELVERALARRLLPQEMEGGTFTVTNLGAYGVDAFTPIINHPQCAILGVGRIRREPAVAGEAIVAREMVTLSLTFDHRLVDGAPAARFLRTIASLIESPSAALDT